MVGARGPERKSQDADAASAASMSPDSASQRSSSAANSSLTDLRRRPVSASAVGAVVVADNRSDPAAHKKFVADEIAKWSPLIKAANVYVDNLDEFAKMNGIYGSFFKSAPPTRTTVAPKAPVERKADAQGRWPKLEEVSIVAVK